MATPERLRLTPRSAVLAVGALGLTLLLIRVFMASERVLGWILTAAVVAGLLHPVVSALESRLRRGLAVAVVAVATLGLVGATAVGVTAGFVRETKRLEQAAPRAAESLERSGRFADAARELKLAERTRRFVDEVPDRLRGGTPADALRSAATRGVAFLATFILTLFFLLHGPRLARAAADQITDPKRRTRAVEVATAAYRRAFGYATGTVVMAAAAGLLAYVVATAAGVPGAAPLGLWAAIWDVVPILGFSIGALPLVLLAAVASPAKGLVAAAVLIAYQVFEAMLIQPRVERRTMRVGPFLTVGAGLIGLEVYGLGGALLVPLVAALGLATAEELSRDEVEPDGSASEGETVQPP